MKVAVILILSFITLFPSSSIANKKKLIPGIFYYNKIFGTIHKTGNKNSETLTTISCGQPLRKYPKNKKDWENIKTGPYSGHILSKYITNKKPLCFQDKYPRFFDILELELSEIYYWGKLYDQYTIGKSRIK